MKTPYQIAFEKAFNELSNIGVIFNIEHNNNTLYYTFNKLGTNILEGTITGVHLGNFCAWIEVLSGTFIAGYKVARMLKDKA